MLALAPTNVLSNYQSTMIPRAMPSPIVRDPIVTRTTDCNWAPSPDPSTDNRPIFFFDIDNCLYPRSLQIHDLMDKLINKYFSSKFALPPSAARELQATYYLKYGLALDGLRRHHQIAPLEYNALVDDALPLEDILVPSLPLRRLLMSIDRTVVKPWLFTNAYVNHGKRVVKLLGIEDCFEGITYCDYAADKLVCKPHRDMYQRAMTEAGAGARDGKCFFVDDSAANVKAAKELGWTAVHLLETGLPQPIGGKAGEHQIKHLEELPGLFPDFFRPQNQDASNI